ncbi:MAG: GCN5-related N-acetyltransferase [Planctomycetaceae bacterium]|nr:GCN5-related N-acetyltransferase [Planctomycetaceae bacterium]
MEFTVEAARTSDFLNIAALDRISWLDSGSDFIPDGEHVWRVWCEHATVLVARTDQTLPESGDIAGALVMFPTQSGQQFLHKIMVHSNCRGQGLGTQLMHAGLQRATAPVLLTVNPQNQAAVHVYEKLGYHVRELVQGYYRPHEHRYVMIYTGLTKREQIELATEA